MNLHTPGTPNGDGTVTHQSLGDSFVNFMSGMGVLGRDKATSSAFIYTPHTQLELEAAYRSDWISRKIVDIPADDATREWRVWQAPANTIERLEEEEKRLKLSQVLKKVMVKARLYGGAALLMGIDQGRPQDEVNLDKIKQGDLKFVVPVSRYEIGHGGLIKDPLNELFGQPEFFTRHLTTYDFSDPYAFHIHPSRVIVFEGLPLPDVSHASEIWGDSVLSTVLSAVKDAATANHSIATMLHEAKVDVIKIPELSLHLSSQEYQERLTSRFMYANSAKSIINAILLDKEEDWERIKTDFDALPEIMKVFLLIVSAAADIPATRFLGQSPNGFSATGESDLTNYYDSIASKQANILTPALSALDEVLIRSVTGRRNPSIYYEWRPLWQMDPLKKAEISKSKADTYQIDVIAGLVDPEALRIGRQNQLIEDGVYPGIEDALEHQHQLELESMLTPEEQDEIEQEALQQEQDAAFEQQLAKGLPVKEKTEKAIGDEDILGDFNPFHEPGGSPKGGRFARATANASALFQTYHDPKDADAATIVARVPGAAEKIAAMDEAERAKGLPPSSQEAHMQDGVYTPERQKLHRKLLGELFTPEAVAAAKPDGKPFFAALGGRGGSGKSFFTESSNAPIQGGYLNINSDHFKEALPEYDGGNAAWLHEESSDITEMAMSIAKRKGVNVVFDATLRSTSTAERLMKEFRQEGYRIEGYYMFASPTTAATRALKRMMNPKSGRYVPVAYVLSSTTNEASFDRLSKDMDHWEVWSNEGTAPVPVSRKKGRRP